MRVGFCYNLKKPADESAPADLYAEWDDEETIGAVHSALGRRHEVIPVEGDEGAFEKFRKSRPDIVFNMAEGMFGTSRKSQIPAMLEMLHLPYTGSDPLTLAMVSHKLWMARNTPYSFATWLTMIPFVVYGLFLFARAIFTFFSPPSEMLSNDPVQTLTYLLLFFISFLWTLGFILMVSQRLHSDLTELATTDSLTHIPNRRATQDFFDRELSRAQRNNGEFSILLIDVDNFKQINDKYGHAMGDHALIKTAQIFQSAIRKQDIVGRWGGEEFLIIQNVVVMRNVVVVLGCQVRKFLACFNPQPHATSRGGMGRDQLSLKHGKDFLTLSTSARCAAGQSIRPQCDRIQRHMEGRG